MSSATHPISTSATEVFAASATRRGRLLLTNRTASTTVYIGLSNAVTLANGRPLAPGAELVLTAAESRGAVWAIAERAALLTSLLLVSAEDASATREYAIAAATRQAVGAVSARIALPTLGATREIYVMATTRCFFLTGNSAVVAAAGASHPLAADERFHLRVPAEATHIAYIRDSADGFISIVPVA